MLIDPVTNDKSEVLFEPITHEVAELSDIFIDAVTQPITPVIDSMEEVLVAPVIDVVTELSPTSPINTAISGIRRVGLFPS